MRLPIFSHSVDYLLILLIALFCFAEAFSFDTVPFVDFALLVCAFGIVQKVTTKRISVSFSPMFSCRIFMAWSLMFESLNHYESIFACCVWWVSNLCIGLVFFQFYQHYSSRRLSFLPWVFLALLLNISWLYMLEF